MLAIIGILVVFGAVLGGYLLEKGHIAVLLQPAELLIIGGAVVGTILTANPPHILMRMIAELKGVVAGSGYTRRYYLETLKMMYELFQRTRREGLPALESDVEDPYKSKIFSQYPAFLSNHHVRDFVCDTLRMASAASIDAGDLDQLLETDMEVHHHGALQPSAALTTAADSLPGLGIVAAVLGVVITMGALGGPPEQIGHKVAAALVGTFLGILLCYGLVGPLAGNMAKLADEEHAYYQVLRVMMVAFVRGISPTTVLEIGRRAIPAHVRPNFQETEKHCRGQSKAQAA
jgi:chemotaxis protein MotA